MNPTAGSTRRKRNTAPTSTSAGDSSIIRYNALGVTVNSDSAGRAIGYRPYVPGNSANLASTVGTTLVSFYSCAKFLPGTSIRWEPACSFTTTGRVYCGFSDNPEVCAAISLLTGTAFATAVQGLGSVISFPVWQETSVPFPTKLRRKMFDINSSAAFSDANIMDRSSQTCFFWVLDGAPISTNGFGNFWYKDHVSVEGINGVST